MASIEGVTQPHRHPIPIAERHRGLPEQRNRMRDQSRMIGHDGGLIGERRCVEVRVIAQIEEPGDPPDPARLGRLDLQFVGPGADLRGDVGDRRGNPVRVWQSR